MGIASSTQFQTTHKLAVKINQSIYKTKYLQTESQLGRKRFHCHRESMGEGNCFTVTEGQWRRTNKDYFTVIKLLDVLSSTGTWS